MTATYATTAAAAPIAVPLNASADIVSYSVAPVCMNINVSLADASATTNRLVTSASLTQMLSQVTVISTVTGNIATTFVLFAGLDGQALSIINRGANTLGLPDASWVVSSNLALMASTTFIPPKSSMHLRYSVAATSWIQTASTITTLS